MTNRGPRLDDHDNRHKTSPTRLVQGETVGQSVGYQIRFINNTSPATRLVFCTTAVMLRKLHSDPNFDRIAVLCVDEVHERDVNTEFLLMAVRERLLRGEMSLRRGGETCRGRRRGWSQTIARRRGGGHSYEVPNPVPCRIARGPCGVQERKSASKMAQAWTSLRQQNIWKGIR